MFRNNRIAVIIAAAGSGKRMGGGIPKQYLTIFGKPIIVKTVEAFRKNEFIDDILVVTNLEQMSLCKSELEKFGILDVTIIAGGEERQDSVYKGLQAIPKDADYVIIHDGARPFVSQKIIAEAVEAVLDKKAVVVAVPVKDTVLRQSLLPGEMAAATYFDRKDLYSAQTPQAFEKALIMKAFEMADQDHYYGTDEGMLVERLGEKVHIIPGEYSNIKITTKEDLPMEIRIGSGYDVHQLVKGRKLIMGGVEIPFEKGLLGHSDADVLVHAIMDALLGAASLGDIGRHFPDDRDEFKGISSIVLLKRVKTSILSEGYTIGNLDVTIICQRPKMFPYMPAMVRTISEALEIEANKINIKATTTEKLGFLGREEGIAAEAVCILNKQ